jgi:hypothetical protein
MTGKGRKRKLAVNRLVCNSAVLLCSQSSGTPSPSPWSATPAVKEPTRIGNRKLAHRAAQCAGGIMTMSRPKRIQRRVKRSQSPQIKRPGYASGCASPAQVYEVAMRIQGLHQLREQRRDNLSSDAMPVADVRNHREHPGNMCWLEVKRSSRGGTAVPNALLFPVNISLLRNYCLRWLCTCTSTSVLPVQAQARQVNGGGTE